MIPQLRAGLPQLCLQSPLQPLKAVARQQPEAQPAPKMRVSQILRHQSHTLLHQQLLPKLQQPVRVPIQLGTIESV